VPVGATIGVCRKSQIAARVSLGLLTPHLFRVMRSAGIIGGLGPESTIDYYRSIIARFRARKPDDGYPHLIINSLDVDKGIAMLDAGRLDDLADYIAAGVELLTRAGADFGLIAANTPHLVFDEVQRRSAIPLLSIVRATADHAKVLGLKRVGLFGTGFTMRANFYPEEFERAGIAMVRPKDSEREFIHRKYIDQLLKNQFRAETRKEILGMAQRMKTEESVEALVLAGTELPLLLRGSGSDIPFLDTTVIHVEAVVNELLS
jgi:aspartate racemase